MARIVITPAATDDLATLIRTHSLPANTRARVERCLAPLNRFPLLGAQLAGRWSALRFIVGPWRWMIVVYAYDADADQVAIVTIQDGRSARSPTAAG